MLESSATQVRLTKRAERALLTLAGPGQSAPLLTQGHVMATPQSTVTYKPIPDYPGYRIGDDGSVWTCWKRVGLGTGFGTRSVMGDEWRRLLGTLSTNQTGHWAVSLSRNGNKRTRYVHRLVLEAFVGPCPDGMECCHNDGNPRNNRLDNLRWDTRKANAIDSVNHGTMPRGETHCSAKLSAERVKAIRADYEAGGLSLSALARKHGSTMTNVFRIVHRRTWKHI